MIGIPIDTFNQMSNAINASVTDTSVTDTSVTDTSLTDTSLTDTSVTAHVIAEPITIEAQFTALANELMGFKNHINDMLSKLRALEKNVLKNKKNNEKVREKQPSGFDAVSTISDDMCVFMNMPLGSKVSRTAVSKNTLKYIHEKNLQDKNTRRKINPDETIAKLFGIKSDTDELTYFNLHKYLNPHFIYTP